MFAFCDKETRAARNHEFEYRMVAADGQTVWLRDKVYVTQDAADNPLLRGLMTDITERRQSDELRAKHSAVVEFSNDAIVSKDLGGIITSWNQGAQRLFDYSAEEAIGRPIAMLIPADRQDEESRILERIGRGETTEHYETVRQRKDGSLVDISLTVSPIRDGQGKVVGASKIARDISERKRAEEALQEGERRFREMIDALPAAIYTTDAKGRLTHFNPAASAFSGRTPELGSDQWCVSWKLYHPDGTPMPHDECPMAITLKEGRDVRGAEAIAERPDAAASNRPAGLLRPRGDRPGTTYIQQRRGKAPPPTRRSTLGERARIKFSDSSSAHAEIGRKRRKHWDLLVGSPA